MKVKILSHSDNFVLSEIEIIVNAAKGVAASRLFTRHCVVRRSISQDYEDINLNLYDIRLVPVAEILVQSECLECKSIREARYLRPYFHTQIVTQDMRHAVMRDLMTAYGHTKYVDMKVVNTSNGICNIEILGISTVDTTWQRNLKLIIQFSNGTNKLFKTALIKTAELIIRSNYSISFKSNHVIKSIIQSLRLPSAIQQHLLDYIYGCRAHCSNKPGITSIYPY